MEPTMIVLRRIEHQRNMRRFYALSLQPDLFGTVSVVREWGRIGQFGTVRQEVCADAIAARAALALRMSKKIKRGYRRVGSQGDVYVRLNASPT
jgi:predicted DNA-binding WGR domain protein